MEMKEGLWNAIKNRLEKPRGLDNGSNALLERESERLSFDPSHAHAGGYLYYLLESHLSDIPRKLYAII